MARTFHQALHGYSDGHRLLACSLPLSSADARTMVVMSDLSGPGIKPGEEGYLTGYPLDSVGKYVLARTWLAQEMPRPGCVWTHSLIIDNADLATLTSFESLLSEFRRPFGPSARSEYAQPLTILGENAPPRSIPQHRAAELVNALYAAPERTVIAKAEKAHEDEKLILAIWMQQWPRLRRAFGFCTFGAMDRSGKGAALDLQLVPSSDRQIRATSPKTVLASTVPEDPTLSILVSDLESQSGTQLREFLRRAGGDVDGGRLAMLPLCRLYRSLFLEREGNLSAAVDAIKSLDAFGSRQARSVRTLIAKKAVDNLNAVDDRVFDFVLNTLERSPSQGDPPIALERIGEALWHRAPMQFKDAIDAGGLIGRASESALATITEPDLLVGLKKLPSFASRIARARPELLQNSDFWAIPDVNDGLAVGVSERDAGRVALALVAAGRTGAAPNIVRRADASELAEALKASPKSTVLDGWLSALMRHPPKAAAVLSSGRISDRGIVVRMARECDPNTIPNDYGEDPWLIAIRAAHAPVGQVDEDYLAAYLMARALGSASNSQAELIQFAYTTLYRAFEQSRLPAEVASMAAARMDWGGWFIWDNCSRLRGTVVRTFIDRHLNPEIFACLTDDGDLALALIEQAAQSGRGRRYLDEVRKRIKNSEIKWIRARADYIAEKIL